jgi:hypothetical protein
LPFVGCGGFLLACRHPLPIAKTVFYRFARTPFSEIPLFPEDKRNCVRRLAIVRFGGTIRVFLEENRLLAKDDRALPKLDVAGSNPVSRSACKSCRILELGYLFASDSAAFKP